MTKGYIVITNQNKGTEILGITHSDFLKLKREKITELKRTSPYLDLTVNNFKKSSRTHQILWILHKLPTASLSMIFYYSDDETADEVIETVIKNSDKQFNIDLHTLEKALYDASHDRKKGEQAK